MSRVSCCHCVPLTLFPCDGLHSTLTQQLPCQMDKRSRLWLWGDMPVAKVSVTRGHTMRIAVIHTLSNPTAAVHLRPAFTMQLSQRPYKFPTTSRCRRNLDPSTVSPVVCIGSVSPAPAREQNSLNEESFVEPTNKPNQTFLLFCTLSQSGPWTRFSFLAVPDFLRSRFGSVLIVPVVPASPWPTTMS